MKITVRLFVVPGLALIVTACAAGQSPAPAVTTTPHAVCITERPIGSHLPRRTCRSQAEVEAERRTAQETLKGIRTAPSVPPEQQ